MVTAKKAAPAATKAAAPKAAAAIAKVEAADAAAIEAATAPVAPDLRTADGGKGAGPKSALKGGHGSAKAAGAESTKSLHYSVQVHTDAKGLEVIEPVEAESGDAAANKVLADKKYAGVSIRGVTPYSDPDPNSLGGERDAAVMVAKANNDGHLVNSLGTEANAEATRELAKADIKDMGE